MSPDTAAALVHAHADGTPEQWATLAAHVDTQDDADYLRDVLGLTRAMHDENIGVDRARTTLHTRSRTIPGRRA